MAKKKNQKDIIVNTETKSVKSVGASLQRTRRSKKVTIRKAAKDLNVSVDILTAIETDNYEGLPKGAYLTGFIRSYVKYLELNPDEIIAQIRAANLIDEKIIYTKIKSSVERDLVPSKILLYSVVILSILFAAIWHLYISNRGYNKNLTEDNQAKNNEENLVGVEQPKIDFDDSYNIEAKDEENIATKTEETKNTTVTINFKETSKTINIETSSNDTKDAKNIAETKKEKTDLADKIADKIKELINTDD